MANHENQNKIKACIKSVKESLVMQFDDSAEDQLELEVKLKDGEVLYCENCHLTVLGPDDLRINSIYCEASNTGKHDFVVLSDLFENEVYACSECQDYWWPFKLNLKEIRKESCKESKSGKHSIIRLVYLCGHQKVKPVVPKEVVISVKEANKELSTIEFHLGTAKVAI